MCFFSIVDGDATSMSYSAGLTGDSVSSSDRLAADDVTLAYISSKTFSRCGLL